MSKNNITGDNLISKQVSDAYRENWENIFAKKPRVPEGYTEDELELDNPYNQWMYEGKSYE